MQTFTFQIIHITRSHAYTILSIFTVTLTLNINCPMSEIRSFADPDARLKQ